MEDKVVNQFRQFYRKNIAWQNFTKLGKAIDLTPMTLWLIYRGQTKKPHDKTISKIEAFLDRQKSKWWRIWK